MTKVNKYDKAAKQWAKLRHYSAYNYAMMQYYAMKSRIPFYKERGINFTGKKILNVACGAGGESIALAEEGAWVVS